MVWLAEQSEPVLGLERVPSAAHRSWQFEIICHQVELPAMVWSVGVERWRYLRAPIDQNIVLYNSRDKHRNPRASQATGFGILIAVNREDSPCSKFD